MLILSDIFIWIGSVGSVINLAAITVERYLKVVHAVWSKTKLRRWMILSNCIRVDRICCVLRYLGVLNYLCGKWNMPPLYIL